MIAIMRIVERLSDVSVVTLLSSSYVDRVNELPTMMQFAWMRPGA